MLHPEIPGSADSHSFEEILNSLTIHLEAAILCTTHLAKARHDSGLGTEGHRSVSGSFPTFPVEDTPSVVDAPGTSNESEPVCETRKILLRPIWEKEVTKVVSGIHMAARSSCTNQSSMFQALQARNLNLNSDADASPSSRCMCHPKSTNRTLWSMVSAVFIAFDLFTLPLLAFDIHVAEAFQWPITLFWTADIVAQTRTGFYRGPLLVMDGKEVFIHYMKGWAIVDIVIVISEWFVRFFEFKDGLNSRRLSGLRVIAKLPRLLRTMKLNKLMKRLEGFFVTPSSLMLFSVLKMTLVLCVLVHLLACGWYWVGRRTENGWVYRDEMSESLTKEKHSAWITAALWVLAQINGRTDQDRTRTIVERGYASLCGMISLVFMSFFVSRLTTRMIDLQQEISAVQKHTAIFERYHVRHNLSWRAIFFAKEYIKNRKSVLSEHEEEDFVLQMLPLQMRTDFLYELRGPLIFKHPLFAIIHGSSKIAFRSICHQATKVMRCLAKEIVFEKGETCERVLFVEKGNLCYCTRRTVRTLMNQWVEERGKTTNRYPSLARMGSPEIRDMFIEEAGLSGVDVCRGMWLSELALWMHWRTRGELFCSTNAELVSVGVEEVLCVISRYLEVFNQAVVYAREVARVVSTNSLSDLMNFENTFDSTDDLEDEDVTEGGKGDSDVSTPRSARAVENVPIAVSFGL
eukprot:TRINITY_DN7628_c0_g2_i1.p1 TRINITY_DN7628_c0_g2~~TRINITY_DN7628_c0_g2_i1.p1  ORF type:complete len:688 (-),score=70.08 TRINITY_DN7628_c0_g2_i1:38-2101(-)